MDNSNNSNKYETFRNNTFSVLPQHYGDNKVVLMVRDPWTIYSYWEINKDNEKKVREEIERRGLTPSKSILRVYSVENKDIGSELNIFEDFELRDWAETWYVHVNQTGKSWLCDVGICCTSGEFFCIARSNTVQTPPGRTSDITADDWVFKQLYEIAGGDNIGKSSLELQEHIEKHLRSWMSSGAISSHGVGRSDQLKESK